jgi:hypothetical protein
MRRFQELAYQIVRGRNERRLQAKKELWDETARQQPYKLGDFVLIKNQNPASGPGKMKLRAKYIGPFRIIKVYYSSVVVVPWTQNARLEEYYRDPNVFRLLHRGDIRPFYTRIVSVKHCKPFKGDIKQEEIIDPIMISRFLDGLGIDNNAEIVSEIDPDSTTIVTSIDTESTTTNSSSSNHSPPPPGGFEDADDRKPMYDDPDPPYKDPKDERGPHKRDPHKRDPVKREYVCDPEMEEFIENLDISEEDKNLLREYCLVKDDIDEVASFKSSRRLDKIKDFIQSADPAVRERAEYELERVLSDMKYLQRSGMLDRIPETYQKLIDKSLPEPDTEAKVESSDIESEPEHAGTAPVSIHGSIHEHSDDDISEAGSLFGMPNLEIGSNSNDSNQLEWDQGHDFDAPIAPDRPVGQPIPDININLPNININIRQPRADVPEPPIGIPVAARSPATRANVPDPFARASRINRSPVAGTSRHGNVADWLAGQSPQHGPTPPSNPVTPQVTRSGRVSRPPARFSPTAETKLEVDMRTALRKSLAEQRQADLLAAKDAKIRSSKTTDAVKIPASRPPPTAVEPEKSKKATTVGKPSTSREFKILPRSKYDQLSITEKRAYNEERERIAASKAAESWKSAARAKATTVKTKTVVSEKPDGNPVEATSSKAPDVDITARSSKTARTPPPSGANRLSDDENQFD